MSFERLGHPGGLNRSACLRGDGKDIDVVVVRESVVRHAAGEAGLREFEEEANLDLLLGDSELAGRPVKIEMAGCDIEKEMIIRQCPARSPTPVLIAIRRAAGFAEMDTEKGIMY